jgi:hypothetical protein
MNFGTDLNSRFWALAVLLILSAPFNTITLAASSPGGADAANAFVQSLRPEQKAKAVFPFYGLAPLGWSYLPASVAFPKGIAVKDLDSLQKNLLFDFMKGYLSETGYDRTRAIMDLENVLHILEPE